MEEYYFTAFESAIHFLENLDKSQLKMEAGEFDKLVAENENKFQKEIADLEVKIQESKEEDHDQSPSRLSLRSDNDFYMHDNLKAITEDIAESIQENYKDVIKRLQDLKQYAGFDPKSKKYYNKNPGDLTIGEIDAVMADYNNMCNTHREISRKLEEINQVIEDKINPSKKQEGSTLLRLFRLK